MFNQGHPLLIVLPFGGKGRFSQCEFFKEQHIAVLQRTAITLSKRATNLKETEGKECFVFTEHPLFFIFLPCPHKINQTGDQLAKKTTVPVRNNLLRICASGLRSPVDSLMSNMDCIYILIFPQDKSLFFISHLIFRSLI